MATKIVQITLEIDGREIKLTVEQARELQKALAEVLGPEKKDTTYRVVEEHHYHRYPYWSIYPYTYTNQSTGVVYSNQIDTSGVKLTLTGG